MSIKLNTNTGFAAIPNDFLQNKNISIEAKGTASFLQSLPHDWRIQAWYVQRELGYGERVWQKVAKELKDCGYLKYCPGGIPGGSYYEFNIWKYETKLIEPGNDKTSVPVPSGNDKMSAPLKSGARKMSSHTNILTINKKTNDQKNNKQEAVVVDFLVEKLSKHGIKSRDIIQWFNDYPKIYVEEKINMFEEASKGPRPIQNPTAWINMALRENFKPSEPFNLPRSHVTPQETNDVLKNIDAVIAKAQTPQSRTVGKQHLDKLTGRMYGRV